MRPLVLQHTASFQPHRGAAGFAAAATLAIAALFASPCRADITVGQTPPPSPDVLYGDLFVAVQTAQIYPDQKTFVDAVPTTDPATIVAQYDAQKNEPGFSLAAFVAQYFIAPTDTSVTPPPGQSLREH